MGSFACAVEVGWAVSSLVCGALTVCGSSEVGRVPPGTCSGGSTLCPPAADFWADSLVSAKF